MATEKIEMGDTVMLEGSAEEWTVYWLYWNGQVELVNKSGRGFNGDFSPTIGQLTLLRKGDKSA